MPNQILYEPFPGLEAKSLFEKALDIESQVTIVSPSAAKGDDIFEIHAAIGQADSCIWCFILKEYVENMKKPCVCGGGPESLGKRLDKFKYLF